VLRIIFLFTLKNPTASAGFEPANLGTKGQHATSRKSLKMFISKCNQAAALCIGIYRNAETRIAEMHYAASDCTRSNFKASNS